MNGLAVLDSILDWLDPVVGATWRWVALLLLVRFAVARCLYRAQGWLSLWYSRVARPGRTALYAWYDYGDQLLYVGISNSPWRRAVQHITGKRWVWQAKRVEVVAWYDTRAEALTAEKAMIQAKLPLHNIQHSRRRVWAVAR